MRAFVLFRGQKDFLNFYGSIPASLSLSHLPLRGTDGNRGYYRGVFPHLIQGHLGFVW